MLGNARAAGREPKEPRQAENAVERALRVDDLRRRRWGEDHWPGLSDRSWSMGRPHLRHAGARSKTAFRQSGQWTSVTGEPLPAAIQSTAAGGQASPAQRGP